MTNLEIVEDKLATGGYSPHDLADYKVSLAAEYSHLSGQLEDIWTRKPSIWNTMRPNHKSDTATERAYSATSDGMTEIVLKSRLKRIEKMTSAISSMLRVLEVEAKNII